MVLTTPQLWYSLLRSQASLRKNILFREYLEYSIPAQNIKVLVAHGLSQALNILSGPTFYVSLLLLFYFSKIIT